MKQILVILIVIVSACASPVMKQKDVTETFQPILDFMEYKPGMTVADVGAGSGAMTVSMATLMDRSPVYIQDIDSTTLNEKKVNKLIQDYSKETGRDLRSMNNFHIVIGSTFQTNLPDATFDLIYSNATLHNFTAFDAMMKDLGKKLKPGGVLYFRDSFRNDHGEGEFCSDPKCGRPLLTIEYFLDAMKRNGFELVKQNPDMSGYPVFGFRLAS